jgi:integrase
VTSYLNGGILRGIFVRLGIYTPKLLTDTKIKSLKAKDKPYKLGDANGLYIYVTKNGTKYWRQKYRIAGKEKLLSHGEYPFISLQAARQLRDTARTLIKTGHDPSLTRKTEKIAKQNDFESIARAWHKSQKPDWSENHTNKVIVSLEKDIFPTLGGVAITDITPPLLLETIRGIEQRGAHEQSRRVTQRCDSVFRYAIASGLCSYNPAQDLKGALVKPKKQNYNTIDIKELPELLDALETLNAHPVIKLATEMLMLTFVRTGELIGAEWTEIDLKKRIWEIPADRMKKKRTHLVPLSERVCEILEELRAYTGHRRYVLASPTKPKNHLSNNAILQALKRMGFAGRMTGHGFRHLASTELNEQGFKADIVEKQLAHIDGSVRGVYNKAEYIEERIELMDAWSKLVGEYTAAIEKKKGIRND